MLTQNELSMNAYELRAKDGFDALTQVQRPSPELGPHDVKVRVRAVSLNYRDLVVVKGAKLRSSPIVPLSDGAGEVIAIGSAVSALRTGDRVAANFFPTWVNGELSEYHHTNALGGSRDGMLCEEVVLNERAWVKIPAHLSYEEAACLPAVCGRHCLPCVVRSGVIAPG